MAVSSGLQSTARLLGAGLCLLLWAGLTMGQTSELAGEYVVHAKRMWRVSRCPAWPRL